MKYLYTLLSFVFAASSWASSLSNDFHCIAANKDGDKFEIVINNMDFAKEVVLRKGRKACHYKISYASYNERSVSPQMIIDFNRKDTCVLSKKIQPIQTGFIKIILHEKNKDEAWALSLIGHQPVKCQIKSFNKKKIKSRIENSF